MVPASVAETIVTVLPFATADDEKVATTFVSDTSSLPDTPTNVRFVGSIVAVVPPSYSLFEAENDPPIVKVAAFTVRVPVEYEYAYPSCPVPPDGVKVCVPTG
jgi:hypothetical protein